MPGILSVNAQRLLGGLCVAQTPQRLLGSVTRHIIMPSVPPLTVPSKETADLVFCDPDPTQTHTQPDGRNS